MIRAAVAGLTVACGLVAPVRAAPAPRATSSVVERERAEKAVIAALESSPDAEQQADALAHLAWPGTAKRDVIVAERARRELAGFGGHGMLALYRAINTVRKEDTAEVVRTILEAESLMVGPVAPEYVPALIDAMWTGSREAKLAALPSLVVARPAGCVQVLIDSAIDDPALMEPVIDALGRLRYESARFWLEKIMIGGAANLKPLAASALAQIGGAAIGPLRQAMKSEDKGVRILAVRAILPAATDNDLQSIYTYLEKHADDDPALAQALKTTASNIEKAIVARDAAEAASAPKDF